MKFFIDSADINEIREANKRGWVDGVTTNPSLVAKTGRPMKEVIKDICQEVDGPISAEVISIEADAMYKEEQHQWKCQQKSQKSNSCAPRCPVPCHHRTFGGNSPCGRSASIVAMMI